MERSGSHWLGLCGPQSGLNDQPKSLWRVELIGQIGTEEAVWPCLVCMRGRAYRGTRSDTYGGRAGYVVR